MFRLPGGLVAPPVITNNTHVYVIRILANHNVISAADVLRYESTHKSAEQCSDVCTCGPAEQTHYTRLVWHDLQLHREQHVNGQLRYTTEVVMGIIR